MKLVFLGDIGFHEPTPARAKELPFLARADLVCANLEGAILAEPERRSLRARRRVALHSSPDVIAALKELGVGAVSLANNHLHDYDVPSRRTRERLAAAGIGAFGAGADLAEAAAPLVREGSDARVALFGFGWHVIGCRDAGPGSEGTNPLRAGHVLKTIERFRRRDADSLVVFVMHWGYELELYPLPAHRQLAHDLAAAGVDAVVGCHPHVAQGAELVAGRPLVYSLGNWLFPPRRLGSFRLAYPDAAARQLALELDVSGREVRQVRLRWHRRDPREGGIEPGAVEGLDGPTVAELTPYRGLSRAAYVGWFRRNRTRRGGLPVYADYRDRLANAARDGLLRARRCAGDLRARLGLKAEQRRGRTRGPGEDGE